MQINANEMFLEKEEIKYFTYYVNSSGYLQFVLIPTTFGSLQIIALYYKVSQLNSTKNILTEE